jgi:hypothetical protein
VEKKNDQNIRETTSVNDAITFAGHWGSAI